MIQSFGKEPQVERVMLLDREGQLRYSSGPRGPQVDLTLASPTCQACHRYPPEQRTSSRVIETGEGTLLRTVIPVHNREACFRCHDPKRRINGILIVDVDAGGDPRHHEPGPPLDGRRRRPRPAPRGRDRRGVRVSVVRRLQRFESTARLIAAGGSRSAAPTPSPG